MDLEQYESLKIIFNASSFDENAFILGDIDEPTITTVDGEKHFEHDSVDRE